MSSIAICALAAVLEGVCAGNNVRPFFAARRFPRHAPPLWVWSIIGGAYYGIFAFVLWRLFSLNPGSLRTWAIAIVVLMLSMNALTNLVIFRMRDLRLSFFIGAAFPLLDLTLLACLVRLDRIAVIALLPYLLYRTYAIWWGHAVWKLNSGSS